MAYQLNTVSERTIKPNQYYEQDAIAIKWVLERLKLVAKSTYWNIVDITGIIEELETKLDADFGGRYFLSVPTDIGFYQPNVFDKYGNIINLPIKEQNSLEVVLWSASSERPTKIPEGAKLISEDEQDGLRLGWIEPVKK